jgi:hypothetical protein
MGQYIEHFSPITVVNKLNQNLTVQLTESIEVLSSPNDMIFALVEAVVTAVDTPRRD